MPETLTEEELDSLWLARARGALERLAPEDRDSLPPYWRAALLRVFHDFGRQCYGDGYSQAFQTRLERMTARLIEEGMWPRDAWRRADEFIEEAKRRREQAGMGVSA